MKFAENLVEVETLHWYDGPLLVHLRDGTQDYIASWFDVLEDRTNVWLVFQISPEMLVRFVSNELETAIPMLDGIKASPAIYWCLNYFVAEDGTGNGELIAFDAIPKSGLPTPDVYVSFVAWKASKTISNEPITSANLVQPATPGESEAVDRHAQLKTFYAVSTIDELIHEMEQHIEKLQARLELIDPTHRQPIVSRAREG